MSEKRPEAVGAAGPRCADLLAALSLVTDLGMGNPPELAMRGCLLGTALARCLGVDESTVGDIYYTTLLRYVGCTAPAHEQAFLAGGDDVGMRAARAVVDSGNPREQLQFALSNVGRGQPPLRRAHQVALTLSHPFLERQVKTADCEVASATARRIGMSVGVQRGLQEIFERWDGRGTPHGLRGEAIALPARFAQVVTLALLVETRSGFEASCAIIDQRAGGQLDPEVAHAFLRLAPQLVEEIASADPWQAVLDSEPPPHHTVTGSRLDDLARAFGDVVDLKTRFTPGHTSGVAHLAEEAARQLRFAEAEVTAVRRAGLLHDLGRAGVANGIWERAGSLTHADWELVRLHAYHSERILDRSPSLELLAPIVGMHHERQDGSGYHRQARSTTIPMTARLLAAADVYDALTHDRPHRRAMASEMAAEQLRAEARSGRLDDDAVRGVLTAAGHSAPEMRRVWPCGLSDREVEVLRLLARGLSTREIAQQLVIAPKTADHHIQHIYTKIGVSTRAAATLFVLEHDLHRT